MAGPVGGRGGPGRPPLESRPVPAKPFVPPARPTFPVDDRAAIAKLVEESLATGSLTLGPNTERLLEDAAHAHGASFAGRPAGSIGDAGAFSFYPTKVITSGEGGIVTTADEAFRDEARIYRDQGKAGFLGGDHVRLGYAWRMSELHAAVGVVQLRRLDDFLATRRRVAGRYDEGLVDVAGIEPLPAAAGALPNYYKYVALLD